MAFDTRIGFMAHNSSSFADTKPHYELLDGLRGVAALLVIWYHIFEGFAFAAGGMITVVNHGYLAVDLFFMLSGFVISYAYDDRLGKSMNLKEFFKRRLIRLHPMVIMGVVVGVVFYLLQGGVKWDGTQVPASIIVVSAVLGVLFIPAIPGAANDIRGNGEMFPLNGPSWSLFFEYIGNILYAILIRRFSNKALTVWTAFLGIGLWYFALSDAAGYGFIGVGWTLDTANFIGGILRMLFPFSLGMLLARNFKPIKIKGAFWICSILLVLLLHIPYIAGGSVISYNGIFEMICITIIFPLLLWIGASGRSTDKLSNRLCRFLGDISFPVYMIHYPIMYLFYSWLIENRLYTLSETWYIALIVIIGSILLAYIILKLYDEPVRRWLSQKLR
jgi:peptidoglycan/LPS O-acetylase OafA/YrhL